MRLKMKRPFVYHVGTTKIHKAGLLLIDNNCNVYILERFLSYTKINEKNKDYFWEKIQIPRGTLESKIDENLLITAIREFTEETSLHYRKNTDLYLYKYPFLLHWKDDSKEYSYQIYIMYLKNKADLIQSINQRFEFKLLIQRRGDDNDNDEKIIQLERKTNLKKIVRENRYFKLKILPIYRYFFDMIKIVEKNSSVTNNYLQFLNFLYNMLPSMASLSLNTNFTKITIV